LEQFDRGQARVEHQRDAGVLGKLFQQQAAQRGLAGAYLAGELHEAAPAALAHAEQQVRERVAVALAEEHEARIRRDRERRFLESPVLEVHAENRKAVAARVPRLTAAGAAPAADAGTPRPAGWPRRRRRPGSARAARRTAGRPARWRTPVPGSPRAAARTRSCAATRPA